jgi:hypothetical protein
MSQNDSIDRRPKEGTKEVKNSGPFIARVVWNVDPDHMGAIRVQIMHEGSNGDQTPGETISARYMSAYWGTTATKFNGTADTFVDTQKAWGMWSPTPDIGTQVIVIFIEGSSRNAFWIGAFADRNKNFMVPGAPATEFNTDDQGSRLPVGEFNSTINKNPQGPKTAILKPKHLLADVFKKQGVIKDDVRGITSSGARRETPSKVFGISTAGPVDYTSPKKSIGFGTITVETPISNLGGTTFVMDDGDHKYVRKTPASEGPPEYVKLDSGSGDPKIPHNELVRIRTRTGHQILLHNSEDLIYIGNASGTTWIELTSNGKVDIFAEDSISIHTKNDLNIKADRDINLQAGRNFNVAAKKVHIESQTGSEFLSNATTKITSSGVLHMNSGLHIETASKIYMNDPKRIAEKATYLTTFFNPTDVEGVTDESIMKRVPSHEPYPHHENLSPKDFLPANTDRDIGTAIPAPSKWQLYTAPFDTFKQGR